MMPFYAPFGPFNPYSNRRVNNYYSPYHNLHNQGLNSNLNAYKSYIPSDSHSDFKKNKQSGFSCLNNNGESFNCDSINVSNKVADSDEFNYGFFDFFGLKLGFDDLLIIAMLFFLYNEEVQDFSLYLVLILLLLT